MTIREIEKLTFAQAKSIAIETVKIKEHDCFFVELGEHFGYSVLVFKMVGIFIMQMTMNYFIHSRLRKMEKKAYGNITLSH